MNENDPITDFQSLIFTERELEVIQLLTAGKSNKQIALQLDIVARSVEAHLSHIYIKLNVCCRTEAVVKLIRLSDK